jgi:hypothetical protein
VFLVLEDKYQYIDTQRLSDDVREKMELAELAPIGSTGRICACCSVKSADPRNNHQPPSASCRRVVFFYQKLSLISHG